MTDMIQISSRLVAFAPRQFVSPITNSPLPLHLLLPLLPPLLFSFPLRLTATLYVHTAYITGVELADSEVAIFLGPVFHSCLNFCLANLAIIPSVHSDPRNPGDCPSTSSFLFVPLYKGPGLATFPLHRLPWRGMSSACFPCI